jgi:hypothetical protein
LAGAAVVGLAAAVVAGLVVAGAVVLVLLGAAVAAVGVVVYRIHRMAAAGRAAAPQADHEAPPPAVPRTAQEWEARVRSPDRM